MLISIVVSTWNNCRELDQTLRSLANCARPKDLSWEVVVVNNNSTDQTERVIESCKGIIPIVSVFEERQGLSHGRNAGLAQATGKWVIFIDDDIRPSDDWLHSYLTAFKSFPEGFFFGGPLVSRFEGPRPSDELLSLATGAVRGFSLKGLAETTVCERTFAGANWAVASKDLNAIGGFDPRLGISAIREMRFGEETDLQDRLIELGLRPVYVPQAYLYHTVPAHKCTPDYILGRAEALAFNKGKAERFTWKALLRLLATCSLHFMVFLGLKAGGREAHFQHYKWRVRRGRIRGLLTRSSERCI